MKIRLLKYKKVSSTNNIAINLIKRNRIRPTIVLSKAQMKGRGTRGKKWISKKGNLFITIFFEINQKKIDFKQYAIMNAFILKNIISKYVNKKVTIKWPNDLLIEKMKVCGILQEIVNHDNKIYLIVGIGINTCSTPNINSVKATSLREFAKKKITNQKILKDIKSIYQKLIKYHTILKFSVLKKKLI